MMKRLKFSKVVKRARLDVSTAQYALKHPEYLKGMPKAGSQGSHREFSLQQAVRLAICTHMTMAGVPLKHAGKIVDFCEHQIRCDQPELFGRRVTYRRIDFSEWAVEVLDATMVRVWSEGLRKYVGDPTWAYLDLDSGRVKRTQGKAEELVRVELNLTELERKLADHQY